MFTKILLVSLARISHTISSEGVQDGATDCADWPRECEKCELAATAPMLPPDEEEELLLLQEAALIEEEELVDGEFVFEEDFVEDFSEEDS